MSNELPIFQIDAFASKALEGNPAAVIKLEQWLPKEVMQKIAAENNLSETAFIIEKETIVEIRWFTPTYEIDLCGHATLASAFALFTEFGYTKDEIIFQSNLSGQLKAFRDGNLIGIDLPARPPVKIPIPHNAEEALGVKPIAAFKARDIILLLENEEQVKQLTPNPEIMKQWDALLTIPTSIGKDVDFVSRVFDPHDSIFEDPVTGSAHCSLVPYWSDVLGKYHMHAKQLSTRGGELFCQKKGDRVLLKGHAVKYLEGKIMF